MVARFQPDYYYWEAVLLLRMGLMVTALVLLDAVVPVQVMVGIMVLGTGALVQVKHRVCVVCVGVGVRA